MPDRLDATVPSRPDVGVAAPEPTLGRDPRATIRLPTIAATLPASAFAADATLPQSGSVPRELPRISLDLRGTLSEADGEPGSRRRDPRDEASTERDLEILSVLGEGGMGRVFLARQHSLSREVAVKTVRDRASPQERAALLSEGAISGHLEHPAVIPVHALGIDEEGRPVLVMKRVEGVTWSDLLEDVAHPAWEARAGASQDRLEDHLEILTQVCNAVHFAHSRNIVHRDIKPANVLLGRYGEVYLGDWGLAMRIDVESPSFSLCGTPAYMAPEMALGGVLDARTDVYLLGATLHHILMGHPPHTAATAQTALMAAATSAPFDYPASVPAELASLANAATSRDPEKRPRTAAMFREAVADYRRHKSSIALSHSALQRLNTLRGLTADDAARASEERQREVDLLIAEARFALRQALDEWAENGAAKDASKELEALVARRQSRAAELERLARDLDPQVSSRQRSLAFGVLVLVGVGLSGRALVRNEPNVTAAQMLLESLGPLAAVVLSAVLLRRHLTRTAVNRRAVLMITLAVSGVTLNRLLGFIGHVSGQQIVVYDLASLATLGFVVTIVLFRWAAVCGVMALAGALVAAVWPDQAIRAFSLTAGLTLIVALAFSWPKGGTR